MLFTKPLRQKIVEGAKTQTRRPIKEGQTLTEINGLKTVLTAKGHIKYQVGRTYAVQYGRGKPTCWITRSPSKQEYMLIPLDLITKKRGHGDTDKDLLSKNWKPFRIKLLDIRQEDVRNITKEDAGAEGFPIHRPFIPFWKVWTGFYDPIGYKIVTETKYKIVSEIKDALMHRPDNLYQAYALTFEVFIS